MSRPRAAPRRLELRAQPRHGGGAVVLEPQRQLELRRPGRCSGPRRRHPDLGVRARLPHRVQDGGPGGRPAAAAARRRGRAARQPGLRGSLEASPAAAPPTSGCPAKPASSGRSLNAAAQCSSADQGRPVPEGPALSREHRSVEPGVWIKARETDSPKPRQRSTTQRRAFVAVWWSTPNSRAIPATETPRSRSSTACGAIA